jgi:hypothetical protein
VFVGVVAAAIAAALGALLVTLGKRRFLELAFSLIQYFRTFLVRTVARRSCDRERAAVASPGRRRTPFSFRYRPPPASFGLQLA